MLIILVIFLKNIPCILGKYFEQIVSLLPHSKVYKLTHREF